MSADKENKQKKRRRFYLVGSTPFIKSITTQRSSRSKPIMSAGNGNPLLSMARQHLEELQQSQRDINHCPDRDYDVVLDHERIRRILSDQRGLDEHDISLTVMTPEKGPRHLDTRGRGALPHCYDLIVSAADDFKQFTKSWFYSFSPLKNNMVGQRMSNRWGGNVQVSGVTPDLLSSYMGGGEVRHPDTTSNVPMSMQLVDEVILLEPHPLNDGVGVVMYLDGYAKEKGLEKNHRATRVLQQCGLNDTNVIGPAIFASFTRAAGSGTGDEAIKLKGCTTNTLPDILPSQHLNARGWSSMWMCVAKMNRLGENELNETEKKAMSDLEFAMACKKCGNEIQMNRHYRKAIEEYDKGLRRLPDCKPLILNKALMHMRLAEYEFAIGDAMVALELYPGDEKAIYRVAQCMRDQGNPKSCVEFLTMCLETTRSPVLCKLLSETYDKVRARDSVHSRPR